MIGVNPCSPVLMGWLVAVSEHSRSDSSESREVLIDLAKNLPQFDASNELVRSVVEKIHEFSKKQIFDPNLSLTAKSALSSLSERAVLIV